jgi:1-acyl-sn-glycerol-3-phosphate acyltransferase
MESMFQLPTVSRGYLITRDFVSVLGRMPTDQEYALLRSAVDARAIGEAGVLPVPPDVPEMLLRKTRNPLGVAYDPSDADYADYICKLFHAMMGRFVELNEEARDVGLDLLVFPQGTRSTRLLPGHIGVSQMALHLRIPIVPIGCNGSDGVYPGASPFGKKGSIRYCVGEPISYAELAPWHISEGYEPFSALAERDYVKEFEGVAALVTERINPLLDPKYQRNTAEQLEAEAKATRGADRFV